RELAGHGEHAVEGLQGQPAAPRVGGEGRVMSLAGKWKKASTTKCAEGYPDGIEFFARPRYLASKGPDQGFIWWDAGSYEVTGGNEVKISIATDEQVSY